MTDTQNNDSRMNMALERLEQATRRAETAVNAVRAKVDAGSATPDNSGELADLKKRHQTLRNAAEKAIRQIDQITGHQTTKQG